MRSALKKLLSTSIAISTHSETIVKFQKPKLLTSSNKNKNSKCNPLDKHGQILRCIVWDSKMKWADKCPHKNERFALIVEGSVDDKKNSNVFTIVWFHNV